MRPTIQAIMLSLIIVTLSGCKSSSSFVIQDLLDIKQEHREFAASLDHEVMISKDMHKVMNSEYNKRFLAPWEAVKSSTDKAWLTRNFNAYKHKKGFGENKLKLHKNWMDPIVENARLDRFPNYIKHAISISNTNIRLLPTHKPHFSEFTDHSNGYPFDNLQNTALAANTPLLITHITKDNAWVYVETAYAQGWVPIRDIAYVGKDFKRKFRRYKRYVAAVDDDFPIKTIYGTYLFQGYIGMVFPLMKESKGMYHIAVPMATSTRQAYLKEALIPTKHARRKPINLTIRNLAWLSDKLIDQPYGWGGLYQNRDCSAMIRDLYAPFGLWLPRNSSSQAKQGGTFIDISKLDNEQKKDFVLENGVPYLSLLWFPGHIMLYIGEQDGEPLVFHNIWGLRTKDEEKRKIIGKSVITTLMPGKESKIVDKEKSFLYQLQGLTLLR